MVGEHTEQFQKFTLQSLQCGVGGTLVTFAFGCHPKGPVSKTPMLISLPLKLGLYYFTVNMKGQHLLRH